MGLPEDYLPDTECFKEGLDIFFDKYEKEIKEGDTLGELLKIGKQVWQQMFEESEKLEETDIEEQEPEDDEESEVLLWIPEKVFSFIEGNLGRVFNMVKKAKWFLLLSESVIVWKSVDGEQTNVLTIKRGKCLFRKPPKKKMTVSQPDFKKENLQRMECFNISVYDRLRVVTTEIRRLLSENRDVEVRLSPSIVLKKEKLKRLLKWV